MRTAILQNRDRAGLRRPGNRALTAACQAAVAGEFGGVVLPEYDSFADLLDRDPIVLGTGDAIDWAALRSAELLVWEWGWTSTPARTMLDIRERFDISFVGRWEPEREVWLERVAGLGMNLSIRGLQWGRARSAAVRRAVHPGAALGLDYARAISAAEINLAFLSRLAGDTITQRSVEIPACGGFMLADRTDEHLEHFSEGIEAAYFEGVEELLQKISYYLSHEDERCRIAGAGRARCLSAGYSYDARLAHILEVLERQQ